MTACQGIIRVLTGFNGIPPPRNHVQGMGTHRQGISIMFCKASRGIRAAITSAAASAGKKSSPWDFGQNNWG